MSTSNFVPFLPGQRLQLKNRPSEYVEFTGNVKQEGKNTFIWVRSVNGMKKLVLLDSVIPIDENSDDALEQIRKGCFGSVADLKRLITYEKLKGTLNEIIYSMEAAQVDFYPYQFKPVLKFISSPTQRLVLADEVGLGKTIESGLIWMEMQARRQAKRLLVICPPTLAEKWEMELKEKFLIDARQADFAEFQKKVTDFERNGNAEEFALICTYSALRPPKAARAVLLNQSEVDDEVLLNPKVCLLNKLKLWNNFEELPFDLVIFDEAHYMRNSSTAVYTLGKVLSAAAQGVLCVSATPVNNRSEDLHSLLSLIDEEFFSSQSTFSALMDINGPTVRASACLARTPIDFKQLHSCIQGMEYNPYINNSPFFSQLKHCISVMEEQKTPAIEHVAQAQNLAEKLNILGIYINRTLRKQVEEQRPKRSPYVCTVDYTPVERAFYNTIEENIRIQCQKTQSEFSILSLISRQLMAASSLPAYAESLLGKHKDDDCLFEIFGEQHTEDENPEKEELVFTLADIPSPKELATCDSKFAKLAEIIRRYGKERIVVFAYYHATLQYLFRRLTILGLKVSMISGKNSMEDRWIEIERFTRGETQILLSSEVGSEGLDLQCAHILINYDMPWNPMRVEQRIGRIDRVGQNSPVLYIINFNIENTIEQRVYQRLHEKLHLFSSTLGDMEAILGKTIRELTVDLFTHRLTVEEENMRISQTAQVLYNKMAQLQILEEQGVELVGLSDYIQRKIEEDHNKGRYIRPEELENYLQDFFGRYFRGTLIQPDSPVPGCMRLTLSNDARNSLDKFIAGDRSRSARNLRRSPLNICFDRNVMKKLSSIHKKEVIFINHLSPLIRWVTKYYNDYGHNLCRTSALFVNIPSLPEGGYVFDIHLWEMSGIVSYKKLSYGIRNIETEEILSPYEGETVFKELLQRSHDWGYQNELPEDMIYENLTSLDEALQERFGEEVSKIQSENENLYNVRKQRILNRFIPRIEQIKQILRNLQEKDPQHKMIAPNKGRIRSEKENMKKQLTALKEKSAFDVQASSVAMGIFINDRNYE